MASIARIAVRRFASAAPKIAEADTSLLRTWGPIGASLNEVPSAIKSTQTFFAHKKAHTYWAKDTDSTVVTAGVGLTVLASLYGLYGITNILLGINKKPV